MYRRSSALRMAAMVLGGVAAVTVAMTSVLPVGAQSGSRTVSCLVESSGTPTVNGKCQFTSGSGGSFVLENADVRRSLTGPILHVTVTVVEPGVAEVRGLTKDGINSRWGQARRSQQDRGCWLGSDFKVCAW